MSVTITRQRAIELGELAVEFGDCDPSVSDSAPEFAAFRQVLKLANAVARGCMVDNGVKCPMGQTVFDMRENDTAYSLALAWDTVTADAGLSARVGVQAGPNTLIRIDDV